MAEDTRCGSDIKNSYTSFENNDPVTLKEAGFCLQCDYQTNNIVFNMYYFMFTLVFPTYMFLEKHLGSVGDGLILWQFGRRTLMLVSTVAIT